MFDNNMLKSYTGVTHIVEGKFASKKGLNKM